MPPQNPIPGGYFLLARKIIDSELFSKPPHYLKLWVWLLSKAFWRNGEAIKRGQIFTTIAELRNVGLYKSGGRLQGRLTEDQVRSAYGFLKESGAVTVSKTTRGILITIVNYDIYQDPESYGPQTRYTPDPTREPAKSVVFASQNHNSRRTGPHTIKDSGGMEPRTTPKSTPDPTREAAQQLGIVREIHNPATSEPQTISGTAPDPTPDPAHEPPQLLAFVSKNQKSTAPDPTPELPRTPHYREYSINKNLKTSCASPTSKRPPSGDHQTFIAWWCMAYQRTQGKPYLTTGKDFKTVKELLSTHGLKPLIIMAAWFLTCQDTWLASKRDLSMFRSQINRIPGHTDGAHNADAYRAAGIIPPEGIRFEEWRFWETDDEAQEALAP